MRYDQFDARWQQEEQLPPEHQVLHNIVDRYDGHGLVLKTNGMNSNHQGGGEDQGKKKVSQMAKRATKLGK